MIISKCIADHARENFPKDSKAFKSIYTLAVLVRILEVVAIVLLAWFFVSVFLIAGGSSF